MKQQQGWISLHRKLLDNWTAKDRPYNFLSAWIYLLLRANHEPNKIPFKDEIITVERGQFVTSARILALQFGWSRSKVVRFLTLLESDSMIERKADTKSTHITILNYDSYQDARTTKEPQKSHKRATKEPRADTDNNDNNINNENKKSPDEEIFDLWRKTFGRSPKNPEYEETISYVGKYGIEQAYQQFKKAALRNIKSFQYFLDNIDNKGMLIDYDKKNGNENLLSYDELLQLNLKDRNVFDKYESVVQQDGKILWRKK